MEPKPPLLIVRPRLSFWVESGGPANFNAVPQAVQEDCFQSALCYDRTGREWPILKVQFRKRPSSFRAALPLRVPVKVSLGVPRVTSLEEVLENLHGVLLRDSEFVDSLRDPEDLRSRLARAKSLEEVIQIAAQQSS